MLAQTRSLALDVPGVSDLNSFPGLADALDSLTAGVPAFTQWQPSEGFDLKRYQSHIETHMQDSPVGLSEIPPLGEGAKKDLIYRFIAVVFMAHLGLIKIWQEGARIMVMKYEADREGQDVPGDLEGADGLEGSLGRAEA